MSRRKRTSALKMNFRMLRFLGALVSKIVVIVFCIDVKSFDVKGVLSVFCIDVKNCHDYFWCRQSSNAVATRSPPTLLNNRRSFFTFNFLVTKWIILSATASWIYDEIREAPFEMMMMVMMVMMVVVMMMTMMIMCRLAALASARGFNQSVKNVHHLFCSA